MALAVGCACVGYLLFVGALVSGLREPVGTHPPGTNGPAPTGPDTGKSARGQGTPVRADAHHRAGGGPADRGHRHRPPSGRPASPPAGSPAK